MSCPTSFTVAVVRFVTVTVHTSWICHALLAVVPLVSQPAPALPGLEAGAVLRATVRCTLGLVAEYPSPALITDTLQWFIAAPILAAWQCTTL